MNYTTCYTGNFLEAADLVGKTARVKIDRVEPPNSVKSADGRLIDKPVVYFANAKKALILNKTNARRIILFYAANKKTFEEWAGLEIELQNETDRRPDMGGQKGPCVRVKVPERRRA